MQQCKLFYSKVVDCGSPVNPDNGQVDISNGTTFGSTAIYTCDPGYTLSGSHKLRTCGADAVWFPTEPTCNSRLTCSLNCG